MNAPKPSDLFPKRPMMPSRPFEDNNTSKNVPDAIPSAVEQEDDEATRARRVTEYQLGNPELPIAGYRERIVEAVIASQATVITAETGAGKSTQVPQFLAEAGYKVIVTQPRVVAARSVAERVRYEVVQKKGADFQSFVGYRTARERGDDDANQILFVTDGLQQVRELAGRGVGKKQVLVLDEVHEWNENMEVLVAWAKKRMSEDPDFKVVVMSATMEAGSLSEYFADNGKRNVPVIEVPGRTFEVKKEEGGDVADHAIRFAREGKNTLVFVPGKAEINEVIGELNDANIPGVTILQLHGQMDEKDQRKVFKRYPGVKVTVSTNVAQTSITIDDNDAVVDSGLERQNQVKNGIEGLYLNPISRADCLQRAGRAGRTKAGEYVLAQLGNNRFVPLAERPEYGTPEILRTRLDGMVLRLAKAGFDAETMDFYHDRDEAGRDIRPEIKRAKERLQKLGALREDGSVTHIGRDMDRMPVESHYARMMIEARKYSPEVQAQIAGLLAAQEADGVCQFETRNRPCAERWRGLLTPGMNDSDMIKQLEVFVAAQRMSDREKRDHDIYVKAFSKAREVYHRLRIVEKLKDQDLTLPTTEQRKQLVKCIISGMVDNLFIRNPYVHTDAHGNTREPSSKSMIRPEKMLVGMPFDLEITTRRGNMTLKLIESMTNVPSTDLLREVAPQLFSEKRSRLVMLADGRVGEEYVTTFNGRTMDEKRTQPAPESNERWKFIIDRIAGGWGYADPYTSINDEIARLQCKTTDRLVTITNQDLRGMLEVALPQDIDNVNDALMYIPLVHIDDVLSAEARMAIDSSNPDAYMGVPLTYHDGIPYITTQLDNDEMLRAFNEGAELPNGKKIMVGSIWSARPVDEIVDEILKIQSIERERAKKSILDAEGAAEGLPSSITMYKRTLGATQNSMGWVIGRDGSLREADAMPVDRHGGQAIEGHMTWDQIRPGELVLSWAKSDVIAPHRFEVVHTPVEGLSDSQLKRVLGIQQEIASKWAAYDECRYDPRGDRSSPPVGRGWGLDPKSAEQEAEHRKLAGTVQMTIDQLTGLSGELDVDLQKRLNMLLIRAGRLLGRDAQAHHEYPNHINQLTSLAGALINDIDGDARYRSGEVSQASLEALKARFS